MGIYRLTITTSSDGQAIYTHIDTSELTEISANNYYHLDPSYGFVDGGFFIQEGGPWSSLDNKDVYLYTFDGSSNSIDSISDFQVISQVESGSTYSDDVKFMSFADGLRPV